jgi:hypothetical protein
MMVIPFSVPQGSVAGPTFYWSYASSFKTVADNHYIKINGYVDDHALLKKWISGFLEGVIEAIITIEECLIDVNIWMEFCRMKMNCDKN